MECLGSALVAQSQTQAAWQADPDTRDAFVLAKRSRLSRHDQLNLQWLVFQSHAAISLNKRQNQWKTDSRSRFQIPRGLQIVQNARVCSVFSPHMSQQICEVNWEVGSAGTRKDHFWMNGIIQGFIRHISGEYLCVPKKAPKLCSASEKDSNSKDETELTNVDAGSNSSHVFIGLKSQGQSRNNWSAAKKKEQGNSLQCLRLQPNQCRFHVRCFWLPAHLNCALPEIIRRQRSGTTRMFKAGVTNHLPRLRVCLVDDEYIPDKPSKLSSKTGQNRKLVWIMVVWNYGLEALKVFRVLCGYNKRSCRKLSTLLAKKEVELFRWFLTGQKMSKARLKLLWWTMMDKGAVIPSNRSAGWGFFIKTLFQDIAMKQPCTGCGCLGQARRSLEGLMESCLCRHYAGPPPTLDPPDPETPIPDPGMTWWVLHCYVI